MRVDVSAKPSSSQEKIEKIGEKSFKVWVKEPPIRGMANAAISKVIADYFSVSTVNIRLVSGFSSRQKVFEVSGIIEK